MSTGTDVSTERLVERFSLKAFVEACLVLEEGVATIRDIDLAMMTGFGIIPPPFARADAKNAVPRRFFGIAIVPKANRILCWLRHFTSPLLSGGTRSMF